MDSEARWQLIMQLRHEQESQWEAGQRVLMEELLLPHSALRSDDEALLDLLYSEILLRRRYGEAPELSEYARRFPELATELARQFILDQEAPADRATQLPGGVPELPGLEVIEELGRGGGGIVFRARDRKLGRMVAVKVGHPTLTDEERARFNDDAAAAGSLVHPNIVTIHRRGTVGETPYFTMEFVAGGSLADAIRGITLPARLAAQIIAKAALGVHFANDAGIVHRDLKPGNILLASQARSGPAASPSPDAITLDLPVKAAGPTAVSRWEREARVAHLEDCEPKIVDFGMAKLLAPSPWRSATGGPNRPVTQAGYVLGTACYMSPEQARGESRSVDRRADVYSLGAILYELLTGKPPFVGEHLAETLRLVAEQEPVPPRRLRPHIPRDLETICLACLEKQPVQRYSTAAALADDLQRFLRGEPILAKPPSTTVRILKWCRRKPLIAGLSLAVAAIALVALGLWSSRNRAEQERLQLEVASTRQRADLQDEQSKRLLAESSAREEAARRSEEEERRKRLEVEVGTAQQLQLRAEAQPLIGLADVARNLRFRQAESVYLAEALPKLRGRESAALRTRLLESAQQSLTPVATSSRRVPTGVLAYTPDGKHVISGDLDYSSIRVWDTANWRQRFRLDGHRVPDERDGPWSTVRALLVDPAQPSRLISGGIDGSIRIWDLNSHSQILRNEPVGEDPGWAVFALAVSPPDENGRRRILSGHRNGQVSWWELSTLKHLSSAKSHAKSVTAVAFRADGNQAASAGLDGSVSLYAEDGSRLTSLRPKEQGGDEPLEFSTLAYSPDGKQLVATGSDSKIHVWSPETQQELRTLEGHPPNPDNGKQNIRATAFVNDRLLLSGGSDGAIRLWDLESGELKNEFVGHTPNMYGNRLIWSIAVSPDGSHFASAGQDDAIRVWDLAAAECVRSLDGGLLPNPVLVTPVVTHVAYSPQKNLAIATGYSTQDFIRAWDLDRLRQVQSFRGLPDLGAAASLDRITALAAHPDGSRFVSAEPTGDLLFWDTESGERLQTVKAHQPVSLPESDASGESMQMAITALAWRPDGEQVVSTGYDHQVKVWSAASGELLSEWADSDAETQRDQPPGLRGLINGLLAPPLASPPDRQLLFSQDGSRVFSAGRDEVIRVWNVEQRAVESRLRGHVQLVTTMALSPDGARLASGSGDGTIVVWDLKTERQIRVLQLRPLLLPDQFGAPVTVRPAWQSSAEQERRQRAPHVRGLAFAPDGRWLAATLGDGTLSLINLVYGTIEYRSAGHEPAPLGTMTVDPIFTPQGHLITIGSDQTVKRWDFTDALASRLELPGSRAVNGARQIAASPAGAQWAIAGNDFQVSLWTGNQPDDPAKWRPEKDAVHSVAYRPDGKRLLIGTFFGRAIEFDIQTRQPVRTFLGAEGNREFPAKPVKCLVAVNHDGTRAASTWVDGVVEVWRLSDCQPQKTLKIRGREVNALAFHPRTNQLAATDDGGNLYLWNLERDDSEPTHILAGPRQSTGLAFTSDGKRLVQAGQESMGVSLCVWEPGRGRLVTTLKGHQPAIVASGVEGVQVFGAAFSPDDQWLATCASDATVRLWKTDIRETADDDQYHTVDVLLAPRIRDLLSQDPAGGPSPNLDSDTGMVQNWLTSVAFSFDSRQLAVVGLSGAVKVFDLPSRWEAGRDASEIREDIRDITSLDLSENRVIAPQHVGLVKTSD